MSEPTHLSPPRLSRETQPDAMQISDCVVPTSGETPSPITQFETALNTLGRMSAGIPVHDHPEVLGEMIIIAAVGTTETYFRDVLSELLMICPLVQENLRGEQITVGAATSYPNGMLGLALVERALFSSRGVIAQQLKRFLKLDLRGQPELAAAVESFERACTCRHAAAHWRGFVDSSTLISLGVNQATQARYQIRTSYELSQRVLAACDHVAHVANQVILDVTLNKWLKENILGMQEESELEDAALCDRLVRLFGSTSDAGPGTGAEYLAKLKALV